MAKDSTQLLGGEPALSALPVSLGGFPVVRLLGEGGMGRVYACRDEKLDRFVAIKVLKPELAELPPIVQRFLREARAMARISSSHVVTVHAVVEEDGAPLLVMEMLEGEDLAARVARKGRLEVSETLRYLMDAVRGLKDAADAGIIHRDVKPANLFLVDGGVKLTDFGLALPVGADARLTQDGLVVGTPHYLAPELARGGEADEVSDIYSLGATLYELLTGKPPYPGEAALDVVSAHLKEPVPSLKKVRPDIPDEVEELLQKMMAKKVAQRFSSYGELRAQLRYLIELVDPLALRSTDPSLSTPLPPSLADKKRVSTSSPSIKTANLTVMFTDIAGYTERTSQQSREEAARWLALHDSLLQPLIRAFRGKLVKTIGDALLVTFTSPTDAVLCGTAIQDRLTQHNQSAPPDDRIHVRVVLSAGEVRVHKGDVLGEPVNLASRLEKLAAPGQVLFSDAVYATMNAAEVKVEAIGEHTFKGIRRSVLVYRAIPVGGPGELPYGGHALKRAADAQPALGQVADVAARAVGAGVRRAVATVSAADTGFLSRLQIDRLRDLPPRALLAFAVGLVLLFALSFTVAWLLDEDMSAREARELLASLDPVPKSERSAADEIKRGRALAALDDDDEALLAFTRAARRGETHPRGLSLALSVMEHEGAERALALLEAWPKDAAVDAALVERLDDDWWSRHNALLALEKRNVATDAHRTTVGVLDVRTGDDCGRRRYGLLLLRRGGVGEQALAAVREAGERMPDNICLSLDLASTERAIERRSTTGG